MAKMACITGGSRRLGRSMAEFLAWEGWDVIIHANTSVEAAETLADELTVQYPGQQFHAVHFDLRDWKKSYTFMKELMAGYGPVQLLVNNASKYSHGKLSDTDAGLLEEMTSIHYFSPLMLMRAMASQSNHALVVNILDAAISRVDTEYSAYLLAKKTLAELSRMAALEYGSHMRVNAIAPGPVLPVEGKSPQQFQNVVNQSPLKTAVDLKSIHSTLKYFIDNKNVTGQIIYCDSGQHLI